MSFIAFLRPLLKKPALKLRDPRVAESKTAELTKKDPYKVLTGKLFM